MFTIAAIILTVVGLYLFTRTGFNKTKWERVDHAGGVMLSFALCLWICIGAWFLVKITAWIWVNMP